MSTSTCCPTACTLLPCTNPLTYLMKLAIAQASDGYTFVSSFTSILTNGVNITGSSTMCCPDCVHADGFYFFGGATVISTLFDTLDMTYTLGISSDPDVKYQCCVNTSLSDLAQDNYNALFVDSEFPARAEKKPLCCATDFTSIVNRLVTETSVDITTNPGGLIEGSTINGVSGIGAMLSYLTALTPTVSKADKTAIFNFLLTEGIVVKCTGCDVRITTANNY